MPPKMIKPAPGDPVVVGPPGGPIYQIWSSNKLDVVADCIVVATDTQKRRDLQEFGTGNSPLKPLNRRSSPWFRRSGGITGAMNAHNVAIHDMAVPIEPQLRRVVETTGGANANHRLVIMANIDNDYPGNQNNRNKHLRYMYWRALRCAAALPAVAVAGSGQPWRYAPRTIAFELLGANPLRWDIEVAANNAMRGITAFFNDPALGPARLLMYDTVLLLVPTARAKDPQRIRRAWEAASASYGINF